MDGTFLLTGVVKGMEHQLYAHLVILAIQFRKSDVVTNQQTAPDTIDIESDKMIAR